MTNAIFVMLLLAALPVSGDQSSTSTNRGARFGAQRPSQHDPYKKLFEPQPTRVTPAVENTVSGPKPKVVCGMTLIPGDPRIDPKMARPRPSNGIDYKLRTIDPVICSTPK